MSDDKLTGQTIREMAKLSLYSNKINEIQEKNLKMYPFVFFDGVSEVKIDYDMSNNMTWETEEKPKELEISYKANKLETKHFRVSYYLTIDEKTENLHMDKRFNGIENAVKNLFWKEVKVQVYFNDVLKFESANVERQQTSST